MMRAPAPVRPFRHLTPVCLALAMVWLPAAPAAAEKDRVSAPQILEPRSWLRSDARAGGEAGTGSGQPASQPSSEEAPSDGPSLRDRLFIETPQGDAVTLPLPSAGSDALVRAHRYGAVYAMADHRTTLWNRTGSSFAADWGVDPDGLPVLLLPAMFRPDVGSPRWHPTNGGPSVPWGFPAADPFYPSSENLVAVADLDGDRSEDVAISHWARFWDGGTLRASGILTVLDGRTGRTLWWKRYPGWVSHVTAADLGPGNGTALVVSVEPPGALSYVEALRFRGDPIEPQTLWSYPADDERAIFIHMDLVSSDPPRVAASWSATATLGEDGPKGRLTLLDAEDGTVLWERDTAGWVKTFRASSDGTAFMTHELDDPWHPEESRFEYAYTLIWRSLTTGAVTTTVRREGAILLALAQRADMTGVAELLTTRSTYWAGTRVALLDEQGAPAWTYLVPWSDLELPFGLALLPGNPPRVAVAAWRGHYDPRAYPSSMPTHDGAQGWSDAMFVLRGTGLGLPETVWRVEDVGIYPISLMLGRIAGGPALLIGSEGDGAVAYDPGTGRRVVGLEVLTRPISSLVLDVNGDGTRDLIVGTSGGAVAALDGSRLEEAVPLWTTVLDGPVHHLALADVDGDGEEEVAAAAKRQVAVLRRSDGQPFWLHHRVRVTEVYWTLGTGDVDGDGVDDVVVPGERLLALDGGSGQQLWQYEPIGRGRASLFSTVAIADANGDGAQDVAAQFMPRMPLTFAGAPGQEVGLVLIDGRTGLPQWEQRHVGFWAKAQTSRSVLALQGSGPPRFAFAYQERPSPLSDPDEQQPVVHVVDATGKTVWVRELPERAFMHTALLPSPGATGEEVFEIAWYGFARVRSTAAPFQDTSEGLPVQDATFARFGPDERYLVLSRGGLLELIEGDGAWTESGDASVVASHDPRVRPRVSVQAEDLDADGTDELIVMPRDQAAYYTSIDLFAPTYAPGPSGLAVVELVQ